MVVAKKGLGQNFLVSQEVKEKIFSVLDTEGKKVVEIGPGTGALTDYLATHSRSLTAYEIDADLARELAKRYAGKDDIRVINADFLKSDFTKEGERFVVVGNLPYYITSDILLTLFKNYKGIESFYGMVQLEVGRKIVAKSGTSGYGKLSVTSQFFGECSLCFEVDSSAFYPRPKVNSAFIKISFFKELKADNPEDFMRFVRECFCHPRKKLKNNLIPRIGAEKVADIYKKFALKEGVRPQELAVETYVNMYNYLTHEVPQEDIG